MKNGISTNLLNNHFFYSEKSNRNLSFPKFFLILFFISASLSSFGAKITWGGGTGNWNVPANWVGGNVPVAGDEVKIEGGICTILLATSTPDLIKLEIKTTGKLIVNGTLNIDGLTKDKEGIKVKDDGVLDNNGSIYISADKEGIKMEDDAIINNYGSIKILAADSSKNLTLKDDAEFNNKPGSVLEIFGTVGTIALTGGMNNNSTFICDGTLEPGGVGAIGTLTIDRDVDFSKATINIEITGTNSSDQINVTGTTTLGGTSTLNLSTINSYQISVGDQFNILNSNPSTSGTFATENLPGCCAWNVEYLGLNQEILVITALTALPVELISFRGNLQNEKTLLSWETASEINNSGFEIERSSDGDKWEMIGFVNGNLTTNNINFYHYRDLHPASGLNYYRLKQMDLDGGFEYSNTIVVELKNETNHEILVYPSPASDKINIHSSIFEGQRTDLKIVNSVGQVIFSELIPSSEDRTTKVIDISTYEKGIYFVIISNGTESYSSNFVVIHSK